VQIGQLRVKIIDSRAFEPQFRHKLRFSIQGQDEMETTKTQEDTATPKWSEVLEFPVMSARKGEDFPQLLIEDINDKDDNKVLTSSMVEFELIAKKGRGKLEKWCAFFNNTKKQVKIAIFYRSIEK